MNEKTFTRSSNRDGLFVRWERAISNGSEMTEEIVADKKFMAASIFPATLFEGITMVCWIYDSRRNCRCR